MQQAYREAELQDVLNKADAVQFYEFCQRTGYCPTWENERSLFEAGWLEQQLKIAENHVDFDQTKIGMIEGKRKIKPRTLKAYEMVLHSVETCGVPVEFIDYATEEKRRVLMEAGYKSAMGPQSVRIPLNLAPDHLIGRMFANTYHSAQKYFYSPQKSRRK